jgi:hypothetical protein
MSHDDFKTEPVRGLPELPPEGERILWQGAPDWQRLAVEALKIRWVGGYFVALAAWRGLAIGAEMGAATGVQATIPYLVMGLVSVAILALIALVQARTSVYTVTNRRVAMRIGAALTVTLNLPFTHVSAADMDLRKGGTGTIALTLKEPARLSYLICWPHVRPWRMGRCQPALRCIPDAEKVARLIAEAVHVRTVEIRRAAPSAVPVAAE